jgi:endonuclease/exonuclease/phosphatase family metal-dependent hydrolase
MAELENLVKSVNKNSVLVGDFNMPDIDWETWTGTRKTAGFLDAVEDALLEQLIDFPTHIKGNCLDLVLTNIPERIFEIKEAGRLGSSDHEMICLPLECKMDQKKRNEVA